LSTFRALFIKELKVVFRGRSLIGTGLGLAITLSATVGIVLSSSVSPKVAAVLYWLILIFSASEILSHTFIAEEEQGTGDQLRLRVNYSLVYLAKLSSCIIFILTVALVVFPLLTLWLGLPLSKLGLIGLIGLIGCPALALCQGFTSYLLSKGKGQATLYPLIIMPIILPILISLVLLTAQVIEGLAISLNLFIVVGAQSLSMLVLGIVLMPYIEESL